MRRISSLAILLLTASTAGAQQPMAQPAPAAQPQPPPVPRAAASSRARVEVTIDSRWIAAAGGWFPAAVTIAGPSKISIEYGQPHARGRQVFGTLVPMDTVWRTGANVATELRTEVDLMFGTTRVPRGIYTLFTLPTRAGWKLVISRALNIWGTDYAPRYDLARVDLATRTLAEPIESLTIWLVPNEPLQGSRDLPSGALKIAWGRTELSTNWRVVTP